MSNVGIALICRIGFHVRIAIARQIVIVIGYSSNQSFLSSYLCYPTALGWKKAISKSPSHQIRAYIHGSLSNLKIFVMGTPLSKFHPRSSSYTQTFIPHRPTSVMSPTTVINFRESRERFPAYRILLFLVD
jgi:hypothetical protein